MRRDARLSFLELVGSQPRIAEILDREALPVLRPGTRVRTLKRMNTAYKAGKYCVAVYSVLDDAEPEAPWLATLTFSSSRRLRVLHERRYAGDPDATLAILLPAVPCLVELFPADWKLPDLALAYDPMRVAELLDATPRSFVRKVTVVRYRPHQRCVLRYQIDGRNGRRASEVVAKLYPYAWKAKQVREKMHVLGAQAHALRLRLPNELGSAGERALVLMERVPGENLADLLSEASSQEAVTPLVEIAAQALATFHGLRLEVEATRSPEDEIRKLRPLAKQLGDVSPRIAARVRAYLDEIAARFERRASQPPCLIHGDYKPSQLLVHEGQPALVDLDRACPGDPAVDVGHFLATFVKEELRGGTHLKGGGRTFLAAYQAQSRFAVDEEGARLFQGLALVRMLIRELESSLDRYLEEGASWRPIRLLDEADACLEVAGS
jgi:aminoglycoside phosphotransferase (APT) family kinase protein